MSAIVAARPAFRPGERSDGNPAGPVALWLPLRRLRGVRCSVSIEYYIEFFGKFNCKKIFTRSRETGRRGYAGLHSIGRNTLGVIRGEDEGDFPQEPLVHSFPLRVQSEPDPGETRGRIPRAHRP